MRALCAEVIELRAQTMAFDDRQLSARDERIETGHGGSCCQIRPPAFTWDTFCRSKVRNGRLRALREGAVARNVITDFHTASAARRCGCRRGGAAGRARD